MATDKEILEASSKNAQYILELEAAIEKLAHVLEQTIEIPVIKKKLLPIYRKEAIELINKARAIQE